MMVHSTTHSAVGGWRQVYDEHRFAILLGILVVLLAGQPIVFGFGLSGRWFDGFMSLLMLAAVLSLCFQPRQRLFAIVLASSSALFSFGGRTFGGPASSGLLLAGHAFESLFFFGAAALIVKSLFSGHAVTFDAVVGALCGYLLLGQGWAVLYVMVESVRPGSFAVVPALASADGSLPPHALTYYSFVTLTTVGFGDITPASPAMRTCSWIEAISGQFYLATIVAGLVSMLTARPRGSVNDEERRAS
jgi:hypothetical protein